MAERAVHVSITGRVHGVGYRAWLHGQARHRAVSGWVRNRPDGSVEAVLSGSIEAVEELASLCRSGPPAAVVFDVKTEAYDGQLPNGFRVLPTG